MLEKLRPENPYDEAHIVRIVDESRGSPLMKSGMCFRDDLSRSEREFAYKEGVEATLSKLQTYLDGLTDEEFGDRIYKLAVYPDPEWDIFKDCNSAHKIQAFTNQILALVQPLILKKQEEARKELIDWVEEHRTDGKNTGDYCLMIPLVEWQSLKNCKT